MLHTRGIGKNRYVVSLYVIVEAASADEAENLCQNAISALPECADVPEVTAETEDPDDERPEFNNYQE